MSSSIESDSILWRTRWWERPEYQDGELLLPGPSRLSDNDKAVLDRMAKLVNEHSIELPHFPTAAMRAMRKLQDGDPDFSQLSSVLEGSPILTAEILRTANSARYGPRCVIDTLTAAISYLGISRVKESVMRAVMGSVTGGLRSREWARAEWEFSVTCAGISRALGSICGADPEQCYVAGLLHDIGRVCLLACLENEGHLKSGPETSEGINIVLEVLHRLVGDHLAESWDLPPGVRDAIANHITGRADYEESLAQFAHTRIVEAAGDLCIGLGIGRVRRPFHVLHAPSFTQLGLTEGRLLDWFDHGLPEAIHGAKLED